MKMWTNQANSLKMTGGWTAISVSDREMITKLLMSKDFTVWGWEDCDRKQGNAAVSCLGVMVDVDGGGTIAEAAAVLESRGLKAVIWTSRSHLKDKDGVSCERFHVFIPFSEEYAVQDANDFSLRMKSWGLSAFPYSDPKIYESHRFFFAGGESSSVTFLDGLTLEVDEVLACEPYAQQGRGKRAADHTYVPDDIEVTLKGGDVIMLSEVTGKEVCYCPFHDDKNPSAFVNLNDSGFPYLHCSTCGKTWWATDGQIDENKYLVDNSMYEVRVRGRGIATFKVDAAALGITGKVFSAMKNELYAKGRVWGAGTMKQEKLKGGMNATGYRFTDDGLMTWTEMADGDQDYDELILSFLRDTFGEEYLHFILRWLAVYAFQNYQRLPVIVLFGPRGTGKTLFAELVSAIYPSLSTPWNGDVGGFNEEFESTLIVIDENVNDKKVLYDKIKGVTGMTKVSVNRKYGAKLTHMFNGNIIITSNESEPLFLRWQDEPDREENNQWFFCKTERVETIDASLPAKFTSGIRHFCEHILEPIYKHWVDSTERQESRYGIRCPITKHTSDQFREALTRVDEDAIRVYEACVGGEKDNFTGVLLFRPCVYRKDGVSYLSSRIISTAMNQLGIKGVTQRKLKQLMAERGLISWDVSMTVNGERFHLCLRKAADLQAIDHTEHDS